MDGFDQQLYSYVVPTVIAVWGMSTGAAGTIGEIWDKHHGSGFSPLDVAVTAWGGLIGAVVTDQFFLAPVASKPQQGGHYVGVVAQYKF